MFRVQLVRLSKLDNNPSARLICVCQTIIKSCAINELHRNFSNRNEHRPNDRGNCAIVVPSPFFSNCLILWSVSFFFFFKYLLICCLSFPIPGKSFREKKKKVTIDYETTNVKWNAQNAFIICSTYICNWFISPSEKRMWFASLVGSSFQTIVIAFIKISSHLQLQCYTYSSINRSQNTSSTSIAFIFNSKRNQIKK